ncbi:MAG: helix-turn-helix domain-containing protein [Prevotella sp.]
MKKLPILIFIVLCLSALTTSYGSYRSEERAIESDMRQALAKTINEKGVEIMHQDSIRAYKSMSHAEGETMTIAVGDETLRRHLREPLLRERAYITYTVGKVKGRWKVMFNTEVRYSAAMIWSMSDQRLSLVLAVMALLSLAFSFRGRRRLQPVAMANFSEAHLTPMQRQLMEMFISSDSHRLSKHEICNALWPKKDDADETLYALISRLKRELSRTTDFDIVSDRGRAYILKKRKSES